MALPNLEEQATHGGANHRRHAGRGVGRLGF